MTSWKDWRLYSATTQMKVHILDPPSSFRVTNGVWKGGILSYRVCILCNALRSKDFHRHNCSYKQRIALVLAHEAGEAPRTWLALLTHFWPRRNNVRFLPVTATIVFVTFQNNIRIPSRTMAYNCWDWIRAWFSSKIDLPAAAQGIIFKGYYDHGIQDSLS